MAGSVLLIDDDVDVLRAIGNYFERFGYEVTRELSGEAQTLAGSTGSGNTETHSSRSGVDHAR